MATRRRRPPSRLAGAGESFAARLLTWFDRAHRDLPWRRTNDAWAILVSEVMLQQTRVEAVRESFVRFVGRYPRPADFARVDDDELLLAWQGLGYYRRARLLRECARRLVADHGGELPADVAALGELPGIGAYTRGAVASIAFGLPEIAVDGNVERVLARHLALDAVITSTAARAAVADAARRRLDRTRAGAFNQALMELGATICTPTSPRCTDCPVAADCAGRIAGAAERLPVRAPTRAAVPVTARCLLVSRRTEVLAFRIPPGEPNAGQWELPGAGALVSVTTAELAAATAARCGARIDVGPEIAAIQHAITHHRITAIAHAGELASPLPRQLAFASADDDGIPWTTIARKLFRRVARVATEAGAQRPSPRPQRPDRR